jgi:GLPGLI family protein
MYYILILNSLFTFINNTTRTSEVKLEYAMLISLGKTTTYKSTLLLNNNYSLFTYKASDPNVVTGDTESSQREGSLYIVDTNSYRISTDKETNNLIEKRGMLFSKSIYYVKENIPEIKWDIKKDRKNVNGFNCNLAEGFFRGRYYTVWFTTTYPFSFGPWKLHGLPGMVVEASDTERKVVFRLNKINLPYRETMFEFNSTTNKQITLKEYVEKLDLAQTNFEKLMSSKTDRGLEVAVKIKIDALERSY